VGEGETASAPDDGAPASRTRGRYYLMGGLGRTASPGSMT
jgi:hypothetical protein